MCGLRARTRLMPRGGALRASFSRPTGGFFMSSISPAQDFADKVAGITTCHLLGAGTAVAANVAATSVYTGQVWGLVGGAAATAAFAAWGVASGCVHNPEEPTGVKPPLGCTKTDGPTNILWEKTDGSGQGNYIAGPAVQIIDVVPDKDSFQYDIWSVVYIDDMGQTKVRPGPRQILGPLIIFLETTESVNCLENGDPNPDISPPLDYTDPDTNCQWTIEAKDAYIGRDGLPHVFWVATANDPACGGPFSWWDSPSDGPQPVGPNPVNPDQNPEPPDVPQKCPDYSDDLAALKEQLDRIEKCACDKDEKPCLEGDWVTTRWISDQAMEHSGARLRKLFRYRSKSSRDLKQLSDYWRDFSWQAGEVCVIHKGAWWGTPQVWASTADEGKRVIRFAGAEAGIDPDQVGEWLVSGSRAPRIGMSGTMRILCKQGFPWVSSRDGSNWPNYLAT